MHPSSKIDREKFKKKMCRGKSEYFAFRRSLHKRVINNILKKAQYPPRA